MTLLAELMATPLHPGLGEAHRAIGPDTIAKFLLTSGSTGNPKAVINTQRIICANQVMIRETMAFLKEQPVIVDWLPWNHTFGGNHYLGLTLYNGGVDVSRRRQADARRHRGDGLQSSRNLAYGSISTCQREYESPLPYLRDDAALRARFFQKLAGDVLLARRSRPTYGTASMNSPCRRRAFAYLSITGLGATETAPFFYVGQTPCSSRSGHVGLPVLGNEAKLVPVNGKLEVRARGPNVTPGYWRQGELTSAAFDDEGFYRFGDAIRPAVADDLSQGFDFDGRIAEDFKLASGTWVSVGPLRAKFIAALCATGARRCDRRDQP